MFLKFCLLTFVISTLYSVSGYYFGRDWSEWLKAKRIVEIELANGRALGISPLTPLTSFDVYTYGLKFAISPTYQAIIGQTSAKFNFITGDGYLLKNDSTGKIEFLIAMPARPVNTCGFVITSSKDDVADYTSKIQIGWTQSSKDEYNSIVRPDSGEDVYQLNLNKNNDKTAFFFDSVPALYFKFNIFTNSGKPIRLKIASINKCRYQDRQVITDCGEKLEHNKKFLYQSYGVPISIKCPTNCIRTWPCWGFKIYSSDSPICWTAQQNFGSWGNGEYTLYKIKKVMAFRTMADVKLNHQINCRSSIVRYPGFTFDRKLYDFTNNETKNLEKSML